MEPVLLYGIPLGCSFGSIVAMEWLGLPYRLCRINMPEDTQRDLFVQLNPVRQTPVLLLENGTVLTESAAILPHLANRAPARRLGFAQGTPEHDRLNETLAFLNTTFFSAFGPLWTAYEMEENPPVQEMLREMGRKKVAKAHEELEALMAKREWLAGDTRTIADAYFIGIARWAEFHGVADPREYPRLHAHIRRLEEDPAVIFAHAIEEQRSATSAGGFKGHVALEDLRARLAV
ncbi:glutathione S-transferase family protein [Archangium violaceum]|uniref:glutathione S-transferase family protein n=1 Tax=Archangium violaceum TaxID=83451 RepID=UPI00193B908F|nr:glutathione S-transferase family protein [Archangium violaceum]QRK12933.1 glutathione S-transferase family protein [Archangium violaceum]